MDKSKCPLCWVEEHAKNPGNPNAQEGAGWESEIVPEAGFTEPTYAFVHCEGVEKKIMFGKEVFTGTNCAIEIVGKPIKCELGGREKLCLETVHMYDEMPPKHLHSSNPGNHESSEEKGPIWKSLATVAEALAEKDAVSDTLWDLRGEILKALKALKLVAPDVTGPEVQGYIDGLILKLVHLV